MTKVPASGSKSKALTGAEFAGLMKRFMPFEKSPRIAVALSGGADSMALTLLLHDWATKRSGSLLALHVDHGLRPDSKKEATWLVRSLKAKGIAVKVLRWQGEKPESAIQDRARRKRYELLQEACRRAGILHLAAAHHLEDQAETFLMRLARSSGPDGLAAMAPERVFRDLRLIRPLLSVPKARLIAFLAKRRQGWVEDPSNQDARFTRVRLRKTLPKLARDGLTAECLGATAADLGAVRRNLEEQAAAYLASYARLAPEGYLLMERSGFGKLCPEIQNRVLARSLMCLGGSDYGPRRKNLEEARQRILSQNFQGLTLGGCRVSSRRGQLLICREAGRIAAATPLTSPRCRWDQRFEISIPCSAEPRKKDGGFWVAPLSRTGYDWIPKDGEISRRYKVLPAAVRASLPVLCDDMGVISAPHLGYRRNEFRANSGLFCRFAPKNPLCPPTFTVV
jgi:tRNA(Ile)-lysidine synthase